MDLSIAMALFFASRGRGVVRGEPTEPEPETKSKTDMHDEPHSHSTTQPSTSTSTYTTPARILLSGLGADELFAGYSRHATAFTRFGHAGLSAELALDVRRLGSRNLGRDDRVVSHWGREVRYPFLDERVVAWAVGRGVADVCGFGLEVEGGEGDEVGDESEPTPTHSTTTTSTTNTATPFPTKAPTNISNTNTNPNTLPPDKLVLRLLAHTLGMQQVAREKKRAIQFGARTAKMLGKTSGTSVAGVMRAGLGM